MSTLFTLTTDTIRLTWSGPPAPVGTTGTVRAWTPDRRGRVQVEAEAPVVLQEMTSYTVYAEHRARTGPLTLHHRDPVLTQRLQTSPDGHVVHGTVALGSRAGHTRFEIRVGSSLLLTFEVEVVPTKLDYRTDYRALKRDVEALAHTLTLAYLQSTDEGAAPADARPTALSRLLVLRQTIEALERGLRQVARQPRLATVQGRAPRRLDAVRRARPEVHRQLARRALQAPPGRVWTEQLHYTLDAPAHRWLRHELLTLHRVLMRLERTAKTEPLTARQAATAAELAELATRVERLLEVDPLRVATGPPPPEAPASLRLAPGYRQAYAACLLLRQGLRPEGAALSATLKDLHVLYEYWCFLTVVREVVAWTGTTAPLRALIRVHRRGVHVRLQRGRPQTLTFPLPEGGRVTCAYNPRFGGTGYVVAQRPDLVLTVERPGHGPRRYVLDAKYRLEASAAARRQYGLPAPPAEALNVLHRYRDAILDPATGHRGTVQQAVALYPCHEDEGVGYTESALKAALDRVGIGAIPALPGATEALRSWLGRVLSGERP